MCCGCHPRGLCRSVRKLDTEVAEWIASALKKSHADEKRDHDEAIARLQARYVRAKSRLDVLYDDRLEARIDLATYERKAAETNAELEAVQRDIDRHRSADRSYTEAGIGLIELAKKAHRLYVKQPSREKRRLLDFLVSNSTWKDGVLKVKFKQPFNMLMDTNVSDVGESVSGKRKKAPHQNWPARPDSNRGPSA